jgi:ubiquinone/menaquinone biosynthesis C-methylase UbiE
MTSPPDIAVWQAFDHAAENYDRVSVLQRQSADFFFALMRRSGAFSTSYQWLDAGCGTGTMAKKIATFGHSVIALDQSSAMLSHVHDVEGILPLQADIHHLPFLESSVDRVVSHFALHWLGPVILPELYRVVKVDGLLWLAIPVQGSFASVRQRYPELPVFDFLSAQVWLDALSGQSVEIMSVCQERWSQSFKTLKDMLHILKLMGGHRLGRAQNPVSPATFRSWLRDVEPIALEYQVLYVQLRKR